MSLVLMPQRYKQAFRLYDEEHGYAKNHQLARLRFKRRREMTEAGLKEVGVVKVPVFDVETCREVKERCAEDAQAAFDRGFIIELLAEIFASPIDRHLITHLESEYAPLACSFYRDDPGGELTVSDGWHCDSGPSRHAIVAAYFTSSAECGGNTLFLDRGSSENLKEVGYAFCPPEQRLLDMEGLTDALDLPRPEIKRLHIEAGDVVVFDAPNLLHRRLLPETASRYTLFTAVIPSLLPWRDVVEVGTLPGDMTAPETFPVLAL